MKGNVITVTNKHINVLTFHRNMSFILKSYITFKVQNANIMRFSWTRFPFCENVVAQNRTKMALLVCQKFPICRTGQILSQDFIHT